MPPPVPGFVTVGAALNSAITKSRGLTRLLMTAETATADQRRELLSEALQKSCELRDELDAAERAA